MDPFSGDFQMEGDTERNIHYYSEREVCLAMLILHASLHVSDIMVQTTQKFELFDKKKKKKKTEVTLVWKTFP